MTSSIDLPAACGAFPRRRIRAQLMAGANSGRRQMPAGAGRTPLTGRRGIGAGHHDRLRFAIEPLLQADRGVRVQDGLSANPGDRLRSMNRTSA